MLIMIDNHVHVHDLHVHDPHVHVDHIAMSNVLSESTFNCRTLQEVACSDPCTISVRAVVRGYI